MATVTINNDVILSITAKVQHLYTIDRAKIDNTTPDVPVGLAEELYDLLMPATDRKKVLELLPPWMTFYQHSFTVRVVPPGSTNFRWCPVLSLVLPVDTLMINHNANIETIPGVKHLHWDGVNMTLYLADDWSALPIKDKDFIAKVANVAIEHDKLTKASKEASNTMRLFLEQHRTLQSAMKAFGPALKTYIDPWLQMELDRVPPKRVTKPKVKQEKVEVNIAKLVTKATATQLNV